MMKTPARARPTISPVLLPELGDEDGGSLFGGVPLGFGWVDGGGRGGEGWFGPEPNGAGGGVTWEAGEGGVEIAVGGESECGGRWIGVAKTTL